MPPKRLGGSCWPPTSNFHVNVPLLHYNACIPSRYTGPGVLLTNAPVHICRADFELRLLSLFSEVGLEAHYEGQLRDLGALLPAIAAAWHERQPPPARQLMSSSSIDFQALQAHQRTEAKLVQVHNPPSLLC